MECKDCQGTGLILDYEWTSDGTWEDIWNTCEKCLGSGEIEQSY